MRGDSATPSVTDADTALLTPLLLVDKKEVTEVTQGVKKVDLAEKKEHAKVLPGDGGDTTPESIPLPDDEAGELDEPAEDSAEGSSIPLEESEGDAFTRPILEAEDCTPDTASVPLTLNEGTEDAKETTSDSEVVEPITQGTRE